MKMFCNQCHLEVVRKTKPKRVEDGKKGAQLSLEGGGGGYMCNLEENA